MSISASIKSNKVVFLIAIAVFVAINAAVVAYVYKKNTAPPVIVDDEGDYEDPGQGGAPTGGPPAGGGVATNPPVKAGPPKFEPVGHEDGVFRDEKRVHIYAGHGVIKANLPFTGKLAAYVYRDADVPPPDKIDRTLLQYNDNTFKVMREVGVTEDQIKKFKAAKGFPPVYPDPTMKNLDALFGEYEKAEGPAQEAALEKLKSAVREAGDGYVKTFAANFAGRKGAMTPEQYTAYRASLQKGFDDAEAKAAADKLERDKIAAEKREADKAAAATRNAERIAAERVAAATRAAAAPPPPPVDPNKPRPLPYPPPPWEAQGGGVHIP